MKWNKRMVVKKDNMHILKRLINSQTKLSNKVFLVIMFLLILTAFCFILAAIGSILFKGMSGFLNIIKSREVVFSIQLSFITAFISTMICICVALPISYGLERLTFRGKSFIGICLDVPMALPPIVSGFALLILFGNTEFGHMLSDLGLRFIFSVKGIVLAQFFINFPYLLRLLRSTIADINPRLEFVARTLGCSQWQVFYRVVIPMAKNGLIAGVIITWSRAIGEFGASLMIAGATRMKTETLPICLYLNLSTGDLDLAMATASVLIVFSVASLIMFEFLGKWRSHTRQ